ncbi:hypothetical protein [Polaribacter cellanae]|uniref:Uncharacterized protein n=1 Tax=Polaribacter cellanae TaxID=2818493 RepID=A0A975CJU3_9FLAO|nr:hypothetical protein [Polaribacter cellanae]QTE21078.1 hypothetical protein J3359_09470 [Polaribacter cellanae]
MRKTNRKKGGTNQINSLEVMTRERILKMQILESEGFIRFLYDNKSKHYIIFNGKYNASFYSKFYQTAERYFKHLISQ